MDQKKQTQVTEANKNEFYRAVYPQQCWPKIQLVQLDQFLVDQYILVDCCGWYYQQCWPDLKILSIETVETAQQFRLNAGQLQGLMSTKNSVTWPSLPVSDCALIFDHSPLFKYKHIADINSIVSAGADKYQANFVILNLMAPTVDGPRLTDRFYYFAELGLANYVVTAFDYNPNSVQVVYKKKQTL